jgi:hypothetical protein
MNSMKNCIKCNQLKELNNFAKERNTCKSCRNNQRKLRPKKIYTEIKLTEFCCTLCNVIKPVSDFDKNKRQSKGFVNQCKLCRSNKNKKRYKNNAEVRKKQTLEYYYNNKEKVYASRRIRRREREKTDLNFKLRRRLRNRLYYALKKKSWKKNTHFSEYIGCSREELIHHIESQFQPGMSWDNYGMWEIDHQIALSLANTPEEMYALCHYTNLKPLWEKDNATKSNNVEFSLYSVKQIESTETHEYLKNNHYLKRIPSISYAFGLYCKEELVGVVTFGIPSSKNIKQAMLGENSNNIVLELNRLWLKYNRKNEASYFISKALKLLPKNLYIISFADSSENHAGYVYQATNFKYYGLTEKRKECASHSNPNLHSRQAFYLKKADPKNSDYYWKDRPRKHRYIIITGKQNMYKKIRYKEEKYPKI